MIGKEGIKYSLRNLKHSKDRSFFTILSIFIGITTIFIFVSFGLGLFSYIDELSGGSSADKVLILAKGSSAPGLDQTFKLTQDDIDVISKVSGVYQVEGSYFTVVKVEQRGEIRYAFVASYRPGDSMVFESSNVGIEKGKDLESSDSNKVIAGYNYQLKDRIFPMPYEINDKIKLNGNPFRISGFLGSVGNPQDDSNIYMNEEAFKKEYPNVTSYAMIIAKVDKNNIKTITERITKDLRKSRNQDEGKEDFYVQSYEDLIASYASALNLIVGFIVLIAIISIIVAAINTANTMITAVLERYKEIGILKAIGAKNQEILDIFLFESSFLGLLAGISGIIAGFVITYLAKLLLISLGWSFLAPKYSFWLFAGCLAFAIVTGAIAGAAPAYKASKTVIVNALRYE